MTKIFLLLCLLHLFQTIQAGFRRVENNRLLQRDKDCILTFSPRNIPSKLPPFIHNLEINGRTPKETIEDLTKIANPADAKNNADNNLGDIKYASPSAGLGCLGAFVKIYTGANFLGASYTFTLSEPEGTLNLSKYLGEHASSIKFYY